jgi:beta-carotene 15,15''-monooxygenase, Brp/Blh family
MGVSFPTAAQLGRVSPGRVTITGSRVALGAVAVAFGIAADLGATPGFQTQMIIYLVGMVALNLPHGGYEHFTNLRDRGIPFGGRYVGLYAGFIAAFVGLFLVAPTIALGLGFATAVAKGGHGDLRVMDALVGTDHLQSRPQRWLAALIRGGVVMVVPLVFWTDTFYSFTMLMISVFGVDAAGLITGSSLPIVRTLGGLFAVGVVAHVGLGFAAGGACRSWVQDTVETLLLIVYFAVVPVVVSIGLYFPLWYSVRQSGRSIAVSRRSDETADGLPVWMAWGALVGGAFVTASVAAGLWVVAPNPLAQMSLLPGLVAFYTIFICVIALPHVVVGEWLDFGRGIWHVP